MTPVEKKKQKIQAALDELEKVDTSSLDNFYLLDLKPILENLTRMPDGRLAIDASMQHEWLAGDPDISQLDADPRFNSIPLSEIHKDHIRTALATMNPSVINRIQTKVLPGDMSLGSFFENAEQYQKYKNERAGFLLPHAHNTADHQYMSEIGRGLIPPPLLSFDPERKENESSIEKTMRLFSDYAKNNPGKQVNVPLLSLDDVPHTEHDRLKSIITNFPKNISFVPAVNFANSHLAMNSAILESLLHDSPDDLARHMQNIRSKLQDSLGLQHLAPMFTDEGLNFVPPSKSDYDSELKSASDILLNYADLAAHGDLPNASQRFSKKINKMLDSNKIDPSNAGSSFLIMRVLSKIVSMHSTRLDNLFDDHADQKVHDAFENFHKMFIDSNTIPIDIKAEAADIPRYKQASGLMWQRNSGVSIYKAAKLWNEYESEVSNYTFPIVHAAMTGTHQKHRPYRKDRPGGNEEWVSSEGSEYLWPEIHNHAKAAQYALLADSQGRQFKKDAQGNLYVKAYRGIGGKYSRLVKDNYDAGSSIPVAPIQSWTLSPDTAKTFAERNRRVGIGQGEPESQTVLSAWLPVKNLVHFGKMQYGGFEPIHAREDELIFHHPEKAIALESAHDITNGEPPDFWDQARRYQSPNTYDVPLRSVFSEAHFKDHWDSAKARTEFGDFVRKNLNTNDPRYVEAFFAHDSFETEEEARRRIDEWAAGRSSKLKNVFGSDGKTKSSLSDLFEISPRPVTGDGAYKEYTIKVKPEVAAKLHEQDKIAFEKSKKAGINKHLMSSPKYWIERMNEAGGGIFRTPQEAVDALKTEVQKFNEENSQKATPDQIGKILTFSHHLRQEQTEEGRSELWKQHFPDIPVQDIDRLVVGSGWTNYDEMSKKLINKVTSDLIPGSQDYHDKQTVAVVRLLNNLKSFYHIESKEHPTNSGEKLVRLTPNSHNTYKFEAHPRYKEKVEKQWNKVFPDIPKHYADKWMTVKRSSKDLSSDISPTAEAMKNVAIHYYSDVLQKPLVEQDKKKLFSKIDKHIEKFYDHTIHSSSDPYSAVVHHQFSVIDPLSPPKIKKPSK